MVTWNYAMGEQAVAWRDALDLAGIRNPDHRLKLSHHPSGWIQFSGRGITSGFEDDGSPRGVAVKSWPLSRPILGPAWGTVVRGIEEFEPVKSPRGRWHTFHEERLSPSPQWNTLYLEAFCFPPLWRRFVRLDADGKPTIRIVHPAHVAYDLEVEFVDAKCEIQNFYGFAVYAASNDVQPTPFFSLGSSSGNMRLNDAGDPVGDGLMAMYPEAPAEMRRELDYWMSEVVAREPG